jgi:hypothetical protein
LERKTKKGSFKIQIPKYVDKKRRGERRGKYTKHSSTKWMREEAKKMIHSSALAGHSKSTEIEEDEGGRRTNNPDRKEGTKAIPPFPSLFLLLF